MIGGLHDPLPIGHWTITAIVHCPWFNYDPERFWNAGPKRTQAVLPPGPNNPAGAAWLGLSREHYGIHGMPDPGHVRHGESAGCIRLTNWDVDNLSRLVRRGPDPLIVPGRTTQSSLFSAGWRHRNGRICAWRNRNRTAASRRNRRPMLRIDTSPAPTL
jgi:L,D-transpeptidase catalytic domain